MNMTTQKKSYVKPEFTIIPAGTPKYDEIMKALEAEGTLPLPLQKKASTENKKEDACV